MAHNKNKKKIVTFAEHYKLGKSQMELDFVDVPVNGPDIALFIDPYSLSRRKELWYQDCGSIVYSFFDHLIDLIKLNKRSDALKLLDGLHESNETKLGYSPTNKGAAIGKEQSIKLFDSLKQSKAVETGLLKDIEECNLMIPGIDRDKISDMTTNIIKKYLIEYTQEQCRLHGIEHALAKRPVKNVFNAESFEWDNDYYDLPADTNGTAVILVPKTIVRIIPTLNAKEYYQHYVLVYLQNQLYSAASSLCKVLKDGTLKKPTKKIITEEITNVGDPKKDEGKKSLKQFLYEFSLQNKDVLQEYEDSKSSVQLDPTLSDEIIEKNNKNRVQDYDELVTKLKAIQPGKPTADAYHNAMVGITSAIFADLLSNPKKEDPIDDGIKRVDIRFINTATYGFFSSLLNLKGVPAPYVYVECKNYFKDIKNPECDQLATRFGPQHGKLGFLTIRTIDNRDKLIKRCQALARKEHGYIIPLTDSDVIKLIEFKKADDNSAIDDFFEERFKEIVG